MSSLDASNRPHTAVDAIAGVLAAASLMLSLVALAYHPARLVPAAVLLALVAARMSDRHRRLALAAVGASMVAWVLGLTIAIITKNPLL